jgi:PAS domain S-box-containing protein
MQKDRIRNKKTTEYEALTSFFDEDIILLNRRMKVLYVNKTATNNLKINNFIPGQTTCKELFQAFNCNLNTFDELNSADEKTKNLVLNIDENYSYHINFKALPEDWFEEELILCKGTKKTIGKIVKKPTDVWNIKIDIDYQIIESEKSTLFFEEISNQITNNKSLKFTDLINENFQQSFKRTHQKAIESGKDQDILSLIRHGSKEKRVILHLSPIQKGNFTDCYIRISPFLKNTEDEITQFENSRLQNYLYTIADEFARADDISKGYNILVSLINEGLNTNLSGVIYFSDKNSMHIKTALINETSYNDTIPEFDDPEVIPYFTRQLIINDIIQIPNTEKSKVLYKKELQNSGIKSFLALPLKHNLRLVGAIILGFPEKKNWRINHINFAKTIGSIVLNNLLQEETSEKLRRVNENFLNIFESSSDAVFIVRLDGKIIEVNRAAETLTGYTKSELLERNVSDISKSENLNMTQLPYEMLQSHQMIFGTEVVNRSGLSIPVETREKMIRYQDKLSVLIIARDVRHRREINKMMVQTISETEDKERQRIAEGLHDDVGPLLSTLRIYIDLLKNEELTEDEIKEYATKMNEIIHQSIETVREVSRNLMPGVLTDFGLIEALEDFCTKINKTGVIRINFDYDAKHYNLGNSIRNVIYTVIKELINNSIKHANASEVLLTIKEEEKNLLIIMKDNGIGFEMEKVLNNNNSGLGIKNLLSKINAISGTIELLNNKGFGVKITIPLQ